MAATNAPMIWWPAACWVCFFLGVYYGRKAK